MSRTAPRDGEGGREGAGEWWRKLLGAVLAAAASVFVALYLRRNWASLNEYSWHLDPLAGGASVALLLASLVWGVQLWRMVVRRMGGTPPGLLALSRVWFLSSLARYVPGKIWQLVGAAGLVDRERMSGPLTGASLLVHMGFVLAAACLTAVLLSPVERLGRGWAEWAVPALTAVALVLALHPRPLSALLGWVADWSGWSEIHWGGGWADGLALLAGGLLSWLLQGAAFWLFASSLTSVDPSALPAMVGINALAFVGGYVTLVVPAGLGVREAILTVLLAGLLPPGPAAVVAVGSRLWTVAGEVLGAGLFEAGWRLAGARERSGPRGVGRRPPAEPTGREDGASSRPDPEGADREP